MDELMGAIKLFAGSFAPRNYAFCQGQIMSVSQNTALFSILGITYGGNGSSTFGLPDLRGRVPVGVGSGPGLANVVSGQTGGQENITLNSLNLPAHNHSIPLSINDNTTGIVASGNGAYLNSKTESGESVVVSALNATATVNGGTTAIAGGSQPFNSRDPYLGLNYIICIQGVFPSRN